MSKYSIDSTTLSGIADAIRLKDGSSSPIVVSDFATKITNIPTQSGGNENPNFTYPYNMNMQFPAEAIKLISNDYQRLNRIVIPYEIWSQYRTITFNYSIYNIRRTTYNLNGTYAKLSYFLARIDNNNIWSSSTSSVYKLETSGVNIFSDFSGTLSDTYTINCENITPVSTETATYNAIVIEIFAKPYVQSDSHHNISFNLGNFTGVKK